MSRRFLIRSFLVLPLLAISSLLIYDNTIEAIKYPHKSPQRYWEITRIAYLTGASSPRQRLRDFSDNGMILGSTKADPQELGEKKLYIWQAIHRMQLLDLSRLYCVEASTINDSGYVAGCFIRRKGSPVHAFSWTPENGFTDLGSLTPFRSVATAINRNGQIVGFCDTRRTGGGRAFQWTREGGMRNLGTLGGESSMPAAINDAGQVVGCSDARDAHGENTHAFLWTPQHGMQDLGTLGGSASYAQDINNTGQVVGDAKTRDFKSHAFLWTKKGGMRDLGTRNKQETYARAINDRGIVVGEVGAFDGEHVPQAFYWTADEGMHYLTDQTVNLQTINGAIRASGVIGIDAQNRILGWIMTDISNKNVDNRVFCLWTPARKPAKP